MLRMIWRNNKVLGDVYVWLIISVHIFSNLTVYTLFFFCTSVQCLVHTVHMHTVCHSQEQSSFTLSVDIWHIAPMENLTEFTAAFQKGKAKGKWHLLQSRGHTFWPHNSRLSVTEKSNQGGKSQHISNCSKYYKLWYNCTFLYSVHVTELQLQHCRTCGRAPKSAHLDLLTLWQQGTSGTHFTTTQKVRVRAQWSQGPHSLTGLQREEWCHFLLINLH